MRSVEAGQLHAATEELAGSAVRDGRCVGVSVCVYRDGTSWHESAHGLASVELDVPVSPQTVFPLASITKVISATLAMLAVESSEIALDASLCDLWPECPGSWSQVTVRHLLTHTSGLPDVLASPMTNEWLANDGDEALERAAGQPLQFETGTEWRYNQTNFVLVGRLLEAAYAKSFEALAVERLLEPLFQDHTAFGDSSAVVHGRGPWYSRIDFSGPEPRLAPEVRVIWVPYPGYARPCAGLNSTAGDLARFVDAVGRSQILSAEARDEMWAPQRLKDGSLVLADPTTRFALGWMVEEIGGHDVVGGTGGASCAFRHAPGAGITVVVLTNTQGSNPDGLASRLMETALSLL